MSEENKNTPKAGYVLEAPWWQLRFACILSCLFSGFIVDWLGGGFRLEEVTVTVQIVAFPKESLLQISLTKHPWISSHRPLSYRYDSLTISMVFWRLTFRWRTRSYIVAVRPTREENLKCQHSGWGELRSVSRYTRLLNVTGNDTYAQTTSYVIEVEALALKSHTLLYLDTPQWPADFIFTSLRLNTLVFFLFLHMILLGSCTYSPLTSYKDQ